MSKKNIRYQMCRELEGKIRLGSNKRAAERDNNGTSQYIHSAQTARTYMQQTRQFGDWLRERGMGYCSIDEARQHAAEYVREQKSSYSQHTARSALAKTFGCTGNDICELGKRETSKITRGREVTERQAGIERQNPGLAEVCRSIGARHNRELVRIAAKDFHYDNDGNMYCHIKGKGGRVRDALVMPGRGRDIIEAKIKEQPRGALWPSVPSHANVHGWRADYAARCYQYALDNGKGSGNVYHAKNNNTTWDKGALDFVSENLGHGEGRYYTVVYNYLSYGKY